MERMSGDQVGNVLREAGVHVVSQDNEGIKVSWDDAENWAMNPAGAGRARA